MLIVDLEVAINKSLIFPLLENATFHQTTRLVEFD